MPIILAERQSQLSLNLCPIVKPNLISFLSLKPMLGAGLIAVFVIDADKTTTTQVQKL